MIRVVKPDEPPDILINEGVEQTNKDCDEYDNCSDPYNAGDEKFDILNTIYGAPEVKNALLAAQHNKCCYCERKFRASSYGEVEHYRPKKAVKQGPGHPDEYPGYYWLAYVWDNLLVSCEVCNRTFKRTYFPLVDPKGRSCVRPTTLGDKSRDRMSDTYCPPDFVLPDLQSRNPTYCHPVTTRILPAL